MSMSPIRLESTTAVEDAVNYPTGKRTVSYTVMFPDGHDGNGKIKDASTFLKNSIEEYGDAIVGKILFKQMVVQAQAAPRPLMKKGTKDAMIEKSMLDWKLDEVKTRSVKDVTVNVYQDLLDRFAAASTLEEMAAIRAEMQAYVDAIKSEPPALANGENIVNGTENSDEDEPGDEEVDTARLDPSPDSPQDRGVEEPPASRSPFQRRQRS